MSPKTAELMNARASWRGLGRTARTAPSTAIDACVAGAVTVTVSRRRCPSSSSIQSSSGVATGLSVVRVTSTFPDVLTNPTAIAGNGEARNHSAKKRSRSRSADVSIAV